MSEKDFEFMEKAGKDLKRGKSKEFICPLCGGKAYAARARINGHLHAGCKKCGIRVMQ
ncbi:hypothetical protein V8Q34_14860 [Blautia sp. JLR.GB0024]|uniref:hypothetical protein n=1 Tax=Blautia sp. JLR.GB0024 TaxID=3123295 RepID=UPI0030045110